MTNSNAELHERAVKAAIKEVFSHWIIEPSVSNMSEFIAAYLAIAPQAPVSAVPVVKPLEWSETRDPTEEIRYTHVIAETPFGIYSIEWKAWRDNDPPCVYLNGDYVECCHNLDAAKNAAKTQLEQRILSALASPPPSPVDADAIIERCAQVADDYENWEIASVIRALKGQVIV